MPAILKLKLYLENLLILVTEQSLKIIEQKNRKTIFIEDIQNSNPIFQRIYDNSKSTQIKYFSYSPMRRMMSELGAKLVSRKAIKYLINKFQDLTIIIVKRAEEIKNKSSKKKLDEEHIIQALSEIGNICSNCGTILSIGANFCHKCGSKTEKTCPKCGVKVNENANFCQFCGKRLN